MKNQKVGSEVTFLRRYNLGSYEHAEYSITKPCAEGDEAATLLSMKGIVEEVHGGVTFPAPEPEVGTTSDNEEVAETEAPKKASKKRGSAKSKPAPEVEEDETEEDEDVSVAEDEVEEDTEEEQEDEVEEVEEEAPAPKKKKAMKSKAATYDRTNDVHKKLFGDAVTSILGKGWSKKAPLATKAKKLSAKLEGKAFLDGSGKVLPSFVAEVKKGVK